MHPIERLLPQIPASPGVYLMKGEQGRVLYVGKAKNLKARLRSYVGPGSEAYPKLRFLVPKVTGLEYIVTETEKEALLLENTLIKRYRPRYNVNLKDDKTYLHILLDRRHPFPRFAPVRRPETGPGREIFGPYASASAMRQTLRLIHKVYPLRTCSDREFQSRTRPCLQYQMGRCSGPCTGQIPSDRYGRMVDQAVMILRGRSDELIRLLEAEMKKAAQEMRFEEAAELRDRIRAVRVTMERQRVVSSKEADRDAIGVHEEAGMVEVSVLLVRAGDLVEHRGFAFSDPLGPLSELVQSFLLQYYSQPGRSIPPEILLPVELEDREAIEEILAELRGGPCSLRTPKRGEKRQLVRLAELNARSLLAERLEEDRVRAGALAEIQRRLSMEALPRRIECFDISDLRGGLAVGSCVSFQDGQPDRARYRRYKIRVPRGADDYGMMYEVLQRRFRRGLEEQDLPDLLLIDGGKGHLGVGVRVLQDLDIRTVHVAAIAKGGTRRPSGAGSAAPVHRIVDRIFVPGRSNPVFLPARSKGLQLLQQVRDEAHRFAITYHRRLRSKAMARSELDDIPGIGPKRRKALLEGMGDMERIRSASVAELCRVPGMTEKAAVAVWRRFHPDGEPVGEGS